MSVTKLENIWNEIKKKRKKRTVGCGVRQTSVVWPHVENGRPTEDTRFASVVMRFTLIDVGVTK